MGFYQDGASTSRGGAAVAVPGEFRGLEQLHQRFGRLPWSKLFEACIDIAEKGVPVGGDLREVSPNEAYCGLKLIQPVHISRLYS